MKNIFSRDNKDFNRLRYYIFVEKFVFKVTLTYIWTYIYEFLFRYHLLFRYLIILPFVISFLCCVFNFVLWLNIQGFDKQFFFQIHTYYTLFYKKSNKLIYLYLVWKPLEVDYAHMSLFITHLLFKFKVGTS